MTKLATLNGIILWVYIICLHGVFTNAFADQRSIQQRINSLATITNQKSLSPDAFERRSPSDSRWQFEMNSTTESYDDYGVDLGKVDSTAVRLFLSELHRTYGESGIKRVRKIWKAV